MTNRFQRHRKKALAVVLLATLFGAEATVRVLARRGVVSYRTYPTTRNPHFWDDIDSAIGVWHYPNAEFIHDTPCFRVTYRTNSYGARDVERTAASATPRRVIVLGDSFVEGFGAADDERMTNLLERDTGIEHMNFGTSGNFGPVQEWLQYDAIARTYGHSEVYVFFLPDNDFMDMDPRQFPADRYRPYLRPSDDGGFETYYPVAFADRKRQKPQSWFKIARRHVYNNVYLVNTLKQIGEPREHATARSSTYRGFSDEDAARLCYAYDRIVERAGERPVTIFVIPRMRDLDATDEAEVVRMLEGYAATRPTVRIVDLRVHFRFDADRHERAPDEYFHSCDGHWSPLGNRTAADAVRASHKGG